MKNRTDTVKITARANTEIDPKNFTDTNAAKKSAEKSISDRPSKTQDKRSRG